MSVRLRERLSASHRDTTGAIARATATLVGACLSVVILSGVDDAVILGDKTVTTPFVGPARYKLFMLLAPLFMTALRIYVDLQLAYFSRLERIVRRYGIKTSLSLSASNNLVLWAFGAAAIHLGPPATIVIIGYHASAFYPVYALLLYIWAIALLAWSAFQILVVLRPRRPWLGVASIASVLAGVLVVAIVARDEGLRCERRYDGFAPAIVLDLLRVGNLSRTDLSEGYYGEANFSCSEMEYSKLEKAHMNHARFWFAYLRRAKLSGSYYFYAEFDEADVRDTDFTGSTGSFAQFFHAKLDESDFSNASMAGAKFSHSILDRTVFSATTLRGSSFYDAQLDLVRFTSADLFRANFDAATLTEVDFSGSDLRRATFYDATLKGATFWNTNLRCASFAGATLEDIDFSEVAPGGLTGVEFPDPANMTGITWPRDHDPDKPAHLNVPSCD